MSTPSFRNWQSVQDEALRRIHAREWAPGELIPNEADLAEEFGCARSTVNRALRSLAESGILDRRRKAGTRVAAQPAARATLTIPVMRHEIEERGETYGYQLAYRATQVPPITTSAAMATGSRVPLLHVRALHLASGTPYALEDRWINTEVVPAALEEDFEAISANEWLLHHAPYTHGEIAFSAVSASDDMAEALLCPEGAALFTIDRVTWDGAASVTKVRLLFAPGYQMRTGL
ncbi:GntR family transcriptional regulator [Gymnodinialimonas ceratoperidinii]|uniref:GntR family transcriptional regulator n=1 Tax=Gymnodinialimonas ceratoperidinii TaxID=2856823 RepID=A0A8F6TWK9_9RHOB|nr:GntR family transcriptional regulator [Gymnodinialimonas ceratoperidinii]QXT39499.1 GntR family transcriptional regulator [Gymnodinialimonas ceratoperidinii]